MYFWSVVLNMFFKSLTLIFLINNQPSCASFNNTRFTCQTVGSLSISNKYVWRYFEL